MEQAAPRGEGGPCGAVSVRPGGLGGRGALRGAAWGGPSGAAWACSVPSVGAGPTSATPRVPRPPPRAWAPRSGARGRCTRGGDARPPALPLRPYYGP